MIYIASKPGNSNFLAENMVESLGLFHFPTLYSEIISLLYPLIRDIQLSSRKKWNWVTQFSRKQKSSTAHYLLSKLKSPNINQTCLRCARKRAAFARKFDRSREKEGFIPLKDCISPRSFMTITRASSFFATTFRVCSFCFGSCAVCTNKKLRVSEQLNFFNDTGLKLSSYRCNLRIREIYTLAFWFLCVKSN